MNLGQVYTKREVADLMVSLFDLPSKSHVLDPCFGGGVFINSLFDNTDFLINAIEIDSQSFSCFKNIDESRLTLSCSNFFEHTDSEYDGIIMNPPYVRQEEIDLMEDIGISKSKLRTTCSAFNVPQKSNLYVYFILHAINLLKKGGELVVIFPYAWKKSTIAPFLETVFDSLGFIQKDITVIGNPFEGIPLVDVCILKFVKGGKGDTEKMFFDTNTSCLKKDAQPDVKVEPTDYTVPLKSICIIKRGLTTFHNAMFINPPLILSDYFYPIVSSPKNIYGLTTKEAKTDNLLLFPKSDTLHEDAISYINLYTQQILKEKKPSTLYNKIFTEKYWFSIPKQNPADIIFPYIIRNQPRFILNNGEFVARDNFYLLYNNKHNLILIALLNNYYVYSQLELRGKNYGNGLLKIQKYDLDSIQVVDPIRIENRTRLLLASLSEKLLEKPDNSLIGQITKVLEPYYNNPNISEIYFRLKSNRLNYEC